PQLSIREGIQNSVRKQSAELKGGRSATLTSPFRSGKQAELNIRRNSCAAVRLAIQKLNRLTTRGLCRYIWVPGVLLTSAILVLTAPMLRCQCSIDSQ